MTASAVEGAKDAAHQEGRRVVVARYGELWLKGKNRRQFETRLLQNLRRAVEPISEVSIERLPGQVIVEPRRRAAEVARRVGEVFGFSSVSPALTARKEAEHIAEIASEVLTRAMEPIDPRRVTRFRVETRRADKKFPMRSTELDRYVADHIVEPFEDRLHIDLTEPELTLGIQLRPERAYVYAERVPGAGGLPVGTLGRVMCLLSGGIDSPVAAWMAMKRGCEVAFVSFHSFPFVGESYLAKVRRLVRQLARFQGTASLYEVPFADVQTAIRDHAPSSYRTVLYRRMMQRIASRLAVRAKASALVTGESLGQVASQTLENLTLIGAASDRPVLRPLIAYDKTETIAVARRIGTFDISTVAEPDCCTVFQPKKPIIHGRAEVCADAESELDVEGLVEAAVRASKRHIIEPE